jgi:hypothetical protein
MKCFSPVPLFLSLMGASLAGVLLVACSNDPLGPQCPSAAILNDTAVLTVFRAGAPADPSGEAYTATIDNVVSHCTYSKGSPTATATFSFTMHATRAPSPDGAIYTLPYFFALTQGERILTKKNATFRINFAPGSAATTDSENLTDTTITLEPGHPPTDYQLLVGFQLTDAERAYNQKRGRFTP